MRLSKRFLFGAGLIGIAPLGADSARTAARSSDTIVAERFVPSADGTTIHDNLLRVTWLADANLPAKEKFGLPVNASGAMTYAVARRWLAALNASNRGAGYLGHNNWTLPATPTNDKKCTAHGPNGNSFGFGCENSPMGSLYYLGLRIREPNTAVPIPSSTVGPFKNFQPYLYWSSTSKDKNERQRRRDNSFHTFSFNTGWQGGNVADHVMYVLPMIRGPLPGTTPSASMELQPSADGQTVYDPQSHVTWLANANLAAEMKFNVSGVVADGAMSRDAADKFIDAMNAYNRKGYLGQTHWELPPTNPDRSCSLADGGYHCTGSPMSALYQLHLLKLLGAKAGEPVVRAPDITVGPFHNIQPYLYWSCAGDEHSRVCSGGPAAPGFEWSFSFGNGFQGTDIVGNSLYVMVYAPDPAAAK